MNRCPYCGGLFIGNRNGFGTHVSSLATGALVGVVVWGALTLLLAWIAS